MRPALPPDRAKLSRRRPTRHENEEVSPMHSTGRLVRRVRSTQHWRAGSGRPSRLLKKLVGERDEGDVIAIVQGYFAFDRPVSLQVGPAGAAGRLHLIIAFPGELDGIALAGTVDGAGEATQGELATGLAEDDIGGSSPYRSPAFRRSASGLGGSCRRRQKLGQADQIVGGQRQGEGGIDAGASSQLDLG